MDAGRACLLDEAARSWLEAERVDQAERMARAEEGGVASVAADTDDPRLTETTRVVFRPRRWTKSARRLAASSRHYLGRALALAHNETQQHYQQLWAHLERRIGPQGAAQLFGQCLESVESQVPLLVRGWNAHRADNEGANPEEVAGFLHGLTSAWSVRDAAAALALAIPLCVRDVSDHRQVGSVLGQCAAGRDKRDGDALITTFLLSEWMPHFVSPNVGDSIHLDGITQLAGSAIGTQAREWEDEDIGWSVRYLQMDFLELWGAEESPIGRTRDPGRTAEFTGGLIFETVLALQRVTDGRLVDHLINSMTEDWHEREHEKLIGILHIRMKPYASWLTRLLG